MTEPKCKKPVMTSFHWRHCYYDTKNVISLTAQDFLFLDHSQSKFLATSVGQALK